MEGSRGRRVRRRDQGETLVELMCAIAIIGIAGTAIMAGFVLLIKSSDIGRKQSTGGAYVRSWAEQIQNKAATDKKLSACGTAASDYVAIGNALKATDPGLAAYTPSLVTNGVQTAQVMSWTGSGWGSCTAGGTQRVVLSFRTGAGIHSANEQLTLVLRPPCSNAPGVNAC